MPKYIPRIVIAIDMIPPKTKENIARIALKHATPIKPRMIKLIAKAILLTH